MAKIFIMDEIEAKPGEAAEVVSLYCERYRPAAEARGMHFEFSWRSPVADIPDRSSTLYFIWSVRGPEQWWAMRIGGDEEKAEWWRALEKLVVTRKRRFLSDVAAEVR